MSNDDPVSPTSNPSLYDVLIEAESYFRQQAKTFAGYRDEAHWQSMATAAAAQAATALSERSQSPSETFERQFVVYRSCAKHIGIPWTLSATYTAPPKEVCPICEPPEKAGEKS